MQDFSNKSFTLIEFLVVIAIVGILAGVIIVSMSGAATSATIAKAKVFSSSMRDSMSQGIVSEWTFNDLSVAQNNAIIKDSWGNNNGTLITGTGDTSDKIRTGNNCVFEKCLFFDGVDDYLTIPDSNSLDFADNFSLEMWLYPYTTTAGYSFLMRKESPGYEFVLLPTSAIQLSISHTASQFTYGNTATISPNNFYHIVASFSKNSFLKIYINGKLADQKIPSYDSPAGVNNNPLLIGYKGWWGGGQDSFYNGIIDDIRVYNTSLTFSKIKADYIAGLNNLLAKNQITQINYRQKLAAINNYCLSKK